MHYRPLCVSTPREISAYANRAPTTAKEWKKLRIRACLFNLATGERTATQQQHKRAWNSTRCSCMCMRNAPGEKITQPPPEARSVFSFRANCRLSRRKTLPVVLRERLALNVCTCRQHNSTPPQYPWNTYKSKEKNTFSVVQCSILAQKRPQQKVRWKYLCGKFNLWI